MMINEIIHRTTNGDGDGDADADADDDDDDDDDAFWAVLRKWVRWLIQMTMYKIV